MNNITSQYNGKIISKTNTLNNIVSKASLDIESQTKSDILSLARKAVGASDVLALQGVFSNCKTYDWKETKRESLMGKLL